MRKRSVITTLVLLGTLCFVVLSAFVLWFAAHIFENEITRLNRHDYSERIRNIEYEYQAVDAVSMASAEVYDAQEELIAGLRDRYIRAGSDDGAQERVAYPFIMNGDGEVVLYVEGSPVDHGFFASEVAARMVGEPEGSFTLEYGGRELWVVFSYFEPWDWVTGYVASNADRLAAVRSFLGSLSIAVVAGLLIIVLVFFLYVRRSLSPLGRLSAAMDGLVEGNLRERLTARGNNEISAMSERFNDFADRLSSVIRTMSGAAEGNREIGERLQSHSTQSLQSAQHISDQAAAMKEAMASLNELAERSRGRMEEVLGQVGGLNEAVDEQFAAVTQSSAASEEMSASLENVARITREKTESSARLRETVREGSEKLSRTREIIADVNGRIDDISNLVSIIQNVAAQTNLLSMNAAIEAAHAGEAGKGFAVVAAEIRKLAEESSENSKSISEIIGAVIERIRSIGQSSAETGAAFESVESEVAEVSDSFQEIASSADELATGSSEIRTSMASLESVSSRVKEGSEQSRAAAEEIVAALTDIDERASEVLEGISAVTTDSAEGVEAVRLITEEVEALRRSVAELNRTISGFEL